MSDPIGKFVAATLVTAAAAYTLVIGWLVLFTIAFFGIEGLGSHLLGLSVLFVMAISPLPIWWYCLKRAAAWLRGERPRL
ncbi:hypothetical protein NS355_00115 [Sphingomonas yabuuchiae]|uniref:Uncharacterized protein n=1 Tax=Sphingomonas yabuuchiae TaxID=172044 RepID=A0A147J103_9SPHN|nr:hypothetical protein [Sphingomonas yabuuchiae]KTW01678.1 hypothetical protein NS355_00115 [Sphingomonas yabuuchiae]